MISEKRSLDTIFIYPCCGKCNAGRLTSRATQELILQGKAEWFIAQPEEALKDVVARTINGRPFIIVDGCHLECVRKYFESHGCAFEFHLSLADLAIEKECEEGIIDEELQLVKDAIIAESTRISEKPPVLLTPCWCR